MTACTWKYMLYFPTSWANSQTRCKKGSLHMRNSVLFWNWQISHRATIPGQYLRGLFNLPSPQKLLSGGLASHYQPEFLLGWVLPPTDINGLILVALSANCLIGDDSGDLPICSSLFTSLLCSTLPGVGGLCSCRCCRCSRCGRCCMILHPCSYLMGPPCPPLGVILVYAILE